MTAAAFSPDLALSADVRTVDSLRHRAQSDPQGAVKDVARQFEALFLQMMLKSMREASGTGEGLFDNDQTRMYTSMLDQQLSQVMAKRGTGLAEVIARQLGQSAAPLDATGLEAAAAVAKKAATAGTPNDAAESIDGSAATPAASATPAALPSVTPAAGAAEAGAASDSLIGRAKAFINRLWPHAAEAARTTGIPPQFMLAQAALETGWGKSEIKHNDGSTTHNLFGIKAGRSWGGATAATGTTEYVDGVAQKLTDRFRAYGSYADSFKDYANLLKSQPRYAAVIEQGQDATGFARGLQQAGYATDPAYADKLLRIINGSLMRQSLAG